MLTHKAALGAATMALQTAPPALKPALQKQLEAARKGFEKAQTAADTDESAVRQAMSKYAGGKLALKTERLFTTYQTLIAARDGQKPGSTSWKQLDAAAKLVQTSLEARQADTLTKTKWKETSVAGSNLDGLADVASRTRDEQVRLTGAPITSVNVDQAAAFDRRKVSLAMKGAFSEYGIQMLTSQFEGADEASQLKLLKLLSNPSRDLLSMLVAEAGKAGGPQFMADALASAKGEARQLLMDRMVKGIDEPNHELIRRLGNSLTFQGNMQVGADLVQALKKAGKTEAANALMSAATKDLGGLRKEFEAAKKKVDAHNAEFSRTVAGFAGAVDPKALESYRDTFIAKHKEDYDAFNGVAGRYLDVFKAAQTNVFGSLERNPLSAEGRFRVELEAAGITHASAILTSQSGQKELDAALKLQLLKQPSWLDSLSATSSKVKDRIELPGKVADLAAKAMVRVAVVKGADPGDVAALVRKNATLLGISPKQADEFATLMGTVNAPHLTAKERLANFKSASQEVSAGEYTNPKTMKALGLLLAGGSTSRRRTRWTSSGTPSRRSASPTTSSRCSATPRCWALPARCSAARARSWAW